MALAVQGNWHSGAQEIKPVAAQNTGRACHFGTENAPSKANVNCLQGLAYLTPLVVTRRICVFRRIRSAAVTPSGVAVPRAHSDLGKKRYRVKSIGWLELNLGTLVFSLNLP